MMTEHILGWFFGGLIIAVMVSLGTIAGPPDD